MNDFMAQLLDASTPPAIHIRCFAILLIDGMYGTEAEFLQVPDVLDRLSRQGVTLADVAAAMRADSVIIEPYPEIESWQRNKAESLGFKA